MMRDEAALAAAHRKMLRPDFPNNLTEAEWRAYVLDVLESHNQGFGAKLKDLYDMIARKADAQPAR